MSTWPWNAILVCGAAIVLTVASFRRRRSYDDYIRRKRPDIDRRNKSA